MGESEKLETPEIKLPECAWWGWREFMIPPINVNTIKALLNDPTIWDTLDSYRRHHMYLACLAESGGDCPLFTRHISEGDPIFKSDEQVWQLTIKHRLTQILLGTHIDNIPENTKVQYRANCMVISSFITDGGFVPIGVIDALPLMVLEFSHVEIVIFCKTKPKISIDEVFLSNHAFRHAYFDLTPSTEWTLSNGMVGLYGVGTDKSRFYQKIVNIDLLEFLPTSLYKDLTNELSKFITAYIVLSMLPISAATKIAYNLWITYKKPVNVMCYTFMKIPFSCKLEYFEQGGICLPKNCIVIGNGRGESTLSGYKLV